MTDCEASGINCPRIYRKIIRSAGGDRVSEQSIPRGTIGRYSEWFWFSTIWTWTGDDLTNVIGNLFILDRFPTGATISMDEFIFELPSSKSFATTGNACGNLAVNGDASDNDGNGRAHFPFLSAEPWRYAPLILEETGEAGNINRFYRTRGRSSSSSLQFRPNQGCLLKGHLYTTSLLARLQSYLSGKMKLFVRLSGRKPTGDYVYIAILQCPEMMQSNDWTTCSAPLLVSEEISSLTDTRWEVLTENEDANNRAVIDFDDISIKYTSGVSVCSNCFAY